MIKRLIILILILSGLYWITSSFKEGENTSIQKETEKKVEETNVVNETNKGDEKVDTNNSKASNVKNINKDKTKVSNVEKKDTVTKKVEKVKTVAKDIVSTVPTKKTIVKTITETPKPTILPTVSIPQKVIAPIVKKVTPIIPDRTTYIKVYMYEWGVDISSKEIPSGTVVFTVVNSGRFSHNFTIGGLKDFGKVPPRQTVSFSAKIPAGSYEIFSERRDDKENGMIEGITVTK